ncbi:MAG: AsmA-like C-terminal region-containing protein [Candidatus Binatia bacterium]|nr:AsmA-like C-terminal region-containing protein [Candidatus Binatia bacterium]
MRSLFRILLGLAALTVVGVIAAGWWFLRPEIIERYVLDSIEERTGIEVEISGMGLALEGVEVRGVKVFAPSSSGGANPAVLQIRELAVRPVWRKLLDGRIVISTVFVDGIDLSIHRGPNGESNLQRLLDAIAAGEETQSASPEAADSGDDMLATLELDHIVIHDSEVQLHDEHQRPSRPLQLEIDLKRLELTGLAHQNPLKFNLEGAITLGTDTHSTIAGSGTMTTTPVAIDADLTLSEVDVDTLVPNVANPDNDDVPGPLPLEDLRVNARLRVDRVRYEGFEFTDAKAVATLEGTQLSLPDVHADIAGGTADVTADIDFGVKGFRYSGTAKLHDVKLAEAHGLLDPIDWGRHPETTASAVVRLKMAGTTDERLLDTIALDGNIDIDILDLDAVLGRYAPSNPRDLGPYDTGDGRMTVDVRVATLLADPWILSTVAGAATLEKSRIQVPKLDGLLAKGAFSILASVDLSTPGLSYSGTISLRDAQIPELTASLKDQGGFGTRTGIFATEMQLTGHGTDPRAVLNQVEIDGQISWTKGRVTGSDYLKKISNITGIPGFRDLVVMNSGGKFRVRKGILSSDRLRLWGPEAGIQASGTLNTNQDVDLKLALGIGPNSNRDLFSTGIALPYVTGKDGWRFIPLNISGNVRDPQMRIPPKAVFQSALMTVPSASIGLVSTGLDAVRGGTRAVLDGARSVVPGSSAAADQTESLVGGSTRLVEDAVRGGGNAIGSVLGGFGSFFGRDDEDDDHRPDAEKAEKEP